MGIGWRISNLKYLAVTPLVCVGAGAMRRGTVGAAAKRSETPPHYRTQEPTYFDEKIIVLSTLYDRYEQSLPP